MRFEPTRIPGVVLIRLDVKTDARGAFARTFCADEMAAAGLPFTVVQANLSRNTAQHTLRGLHYQREPHGEPKIVSCPRGSIWDVAVDMRPDSPAYRQWLAFELSPMSDTVLHLPTGVAHGFMTLEPDSEVHYLMGAAYVPGAATGVRWDEPALGIDWPAIPSVVSDADRHYALLGAA
ncbi:dTDP-4-dehydrorhamnose 3,5-epimerase family protein [Sphingomonas aliaeris]|uniref:dTDP-4-dehydrorhamnose 3,5-epimerase n=1 Tax=Sphingomonas aliaeris TaxID=2759526 RepID=A0A974NX08_9SPHN|nr:dTDP-4-dehydrorhamnose 3,5-epimerase family protein [Sphingomonas aliaeris]QQV78466.1 dTDP-4-dehydrorhamnose 3,5-epimerase family protein [Sphingomonas aliaeris]